MTKKVIVSAALLLALLVTIPIVAILFFLNPVVEGLKPSIVQSIGGVLGAPVEIGPISVSVFPSPKLAVNDLRIGSAATLGTLAAQTTLGELIRGNIFVQEIEFADGTATVLRKPDGSISIGEIELTKSAKAHGAGGSKGAGKQKGDAPAEKSVRYEIDRVRFSNLKAEILDQSIAPEQRFIIQDLSGSATNIGGLKPAEIDLQASLFGTSPKNISAKGTVVIPSLSTDLPNVKGDFTIRNLHLQQVSDLFRVYGATMPGLALDGTMTASGNVEPSANGLRFAAKSDATDAKAVFKDTFQKNLAETFSVEVSGEFVPPKNVDLASFDIVLGSAHVKGSAKVSKHLDSISLRSEDLALGDLSRFLPLLQSYKLGGDLSLDLTLAGQPLLASGTIVLDKVSGEAGGTPFTDLGGTASLKDQLIKTEKLQGVFGGISMSVAAEIKQLPDKLELLPSTIQAFGGKTEIKGQLERAGGKAFAVNIRASDIDLKQLQTVIQKLPVTGTLKLLTSALHGSSTAPSSTLSGTFAITAESGEIQGVNVLGNVLRKLGSIPGVKAQIVESVPAEFRSILDSDNTRYESLVVDGSIAGSDLAISRATLEHSLYRITGSGNINFSGDMTLKTRLELLPKLAEKMVEREKNLRYLLDRGGNIVIPVVVSRQGGSTVVLPDASVLIQNAATSAVKDSAKKALDKITPGLGGTLDSLFK